MYFQTAVGDNEARLLSILEIARNRSNLIILTGGLGPTEDDLTKQTLSKFLNRRLVFEPEWLRRNWIASSQVDQTMCEHPIMSDKLR